MLWQEELNIIDQLSSRLANLSSDVSRQVTQFESRKTTLDNDIVKLNSEYDALLARNEEARRQFQKSQRLDLEKLQEDQRRVKAKEVVLIEKEKELNRLRAEMEMLMAQAKAESVKSGGKKHV